MRLARPILKEWTLEDIEQNIESEYEREGVLCFGSVGHYGCIGDVSMDGLVRYDWEKDELSLFEENEKDSKKEKLAYDS